MINNIPEHERLFSEICGKLKELSDRQESGIAEGSLAKIEKMQSQLKKSQDELIEVYSQIQNKIQSFDEMSFQNENRDEEIQKLTDQLESERSTNTKLSTDLAKALELNLKLQLEVEESRSKSSLAIQEEKKYNHFLNEKVKSLTHELELNEALKQEAHRELNRAKEALQEASKNWELTHLSLKSEAARARSLLEEQNSSLLVLESELKNKESEIQKLSVNFSEYDNHLQQQSETIAKLSDVAEKKLIELKVALDKKTLECQDYYSHLQKALTQINILKQENLALKDYFQKSAKLQPAVSLEGSSSPNY